MARKIEIFDTTLRDGNKLPFVVLSSQDRLEIALQLEALGVDVIEAGFPVSSAEEFECVARISREVKGAYVSALARALPQDVEKTLEAVKPAARPHLHIFMPVSPESLSGVVKMSEAEAIATVRTCVGICRAAGVRVQFSLSEAPHARPDFRTALCRAAADEGVDVLNFADTNGILLPEDMEAMVRDSLEFLGPDGPTVGVHCHNDLGLASANTLAAIKAGASHAEVTLGGFGERAGNAALEEMAFLIEAFGERLSIRHGIKLDRIAATAALFDGITGIHTHPNKPIIGRSALAEPGASASGRSLPARMRALLQAGTIGRGREAPSVEPRPADLEQPYELESFNLLTGSHSPPVGVVVIRRGGSLLTQSSHGNGPIDALFRAVDKALGFSTRMVLYSVYTLAAGTEADTEVSVTAEINGRRFHGRHTCANTIEASVRAYMKACNGIASSGILERGSGFYVQGEYLWE